MTKYLGDADRGRQRLYTHEGGRHRCKQSGIRDDVRPGTHEEGQVTWNERRVTFKIKQEFHKTDPKDKTTSPRCDRVERETAVTQWFIRASLLPLASPGAAIKRRQPISRSNLLSIIHTHSEQTAHKLWGGGTEQHHIHTQNNDPGSKHHTHPPAGALSPHQECLHLTTHFRSKKINMYAHIFQVPHTHNLTSDLLGTLDTAAHQVTSLFYQNTHLLLEFILMF